MVKKLNPKDKRLIKTLDRVLSKRGLGSRTDARAWILAGKVRVNGKVIVNPDYWVDLELDQVAFSGKPVQAVKKSYILLYKPTGYVTSHGDPAGRPTVYDLISQIGKWLAPVGRLDLDTSGLLIMTNDNEFAERITNPERKVPKTYLVKSSTILTDEQLERLRSGVELDDGPTRPAKVERLRDGPKATFVEITITEGRNRQVRRMIEALDSKVLKLVRVAIGPISIGELQIGKWRNMTPQEVELLARKAPGHQKRLSRKP